MERIVIEVDSKGVATAKKNLDALSITLDKTKVSVNAVRKSFNLMNRAMRRVGTTANSAQKSAASMQASVRGMSRSSMAATSNLVAMSKAGKRAAASVAQLDRRMRRYEKGAASANRQTKKLVKTLTFLKVASLAFIAIRVGRFLTGVAVGVAKLSDSYTELRTRLRVVTKDQTQSEEVFRRLVSLSQDTRTSLEATSKAYSRTALAVQNLGFSQNDALKFTENLNKAIKVGGSSTIESANAMIQLSQGLSSNRLSGDELRSVLEQMPLVADLIAKGFNKANKGVKVFRGDLRALGKAGLLDSKLVFTAMLEASEQMSEKFKLAIRTMAEGWQVAKDGFMVMVGAIDDELGIGSAISKALDALGKSFVNIQDDLAATLKVLGGFGEHENTLQDMFTINVESLREAAIVMAQMQDAFNTGRFLRENIEAGLKTVKNAALGRPTTGSIQEAERASDNLLGSLSGQGPSVRALQAEFAKIDERKKTVANLTSSLDQKGTEVKSVLPAGVGKKKKKGRKLRDSEQILSDLRLKLNLEKMLTREAKIQKEFYAFEKKIVASNLSLIKDEVSKTAAINKALDRGDALIREKALLEEQKEVLKEIDKLSTKALETENKKFETQRKTLEDKNVERLIALDEERSSLDDPTTVDGAFSDANREFLQSGITMGDSLVKIFGPGGTLEQGTNNLQEGMAKLIIGGQIFGRSWKDISADIDTLGKQVLTNVLSEIVNIGVEMAKNATIGALRRSAEKAAIDTDAAIGLLKYEAKLKAITLLHGKAMLQIKAVNEATGIAATEASTASSSEAGFAALDSAKSGIISGLAGAAVKGFSSGGFTGNGGINQAAGIVHGQEFVMPANQTAKNRSELEAMKAGRSSGGSAKLNVVVNNNAPATDVQVNQRSDGELEVMITRAIQRDAPGVIAGDMNNPSSRTSRAMSRNTSAQRRRGG